MNHIIDRAQLTDRIVCDSAGTSAYHIGEPPDRRMTAAAKQQGISLCGRARQFTKADFEAFDLILVMDRDNFAGVNYLDPVGKYKHKVHLVCDFCTHHTLREVPDPYYGGAEGFTQVIDLLLDACQGVLHHVQNELPH